MLISKEIEQIFNEIGEATMEDVAAHLQARGIDITRKGVSSHLSNLTIIGRLKKVSSGKKGYTRWCKPGVKKVVCGAFEEKPHWIVTTQFSDLQRIHGGYYAR